VCDFIVSESAALSAHDAATDTSPNVTRALASARHAARVIAPVVVTAVAADSRTVPFADARTVCAHTCCALAAAVLHDGRLRKAVRAYRARVADKVHLDHRTSPNTIDDDDDDDDDDNVSDNNIITIRRDAHRSVVTCAQATATVDCCVFTTSGRRCCEPFATRRRQGAVR
jgi:hypothetical protein